MADSEVGAHERSDDLALVQAHDTHAPRFCTACGARVGNVTGFCVQCGAPLSRTDTPGEPAGNVRAETAQAEETVRGSAAGGAQTTGFFTARTTAVAAREWQKSLPGPFDLIPLELLAVCALMGMAGLLTLWPVIKSLPDTIKLFGYGGYGRALGVLFLCVWIELAFFGIACLLLAWRMAHADRVARGLSYVLLGGIAAATLFGNVHDAALILVMLASLAATAVLWFAPGVRAFFAGAEAPQAGQPAPVMIGRTLIAVWGACALLNGLMFLALGDLGSSYVPVGIVLIGAGIGAFAVNRQIAQANELGRRIASGGAALYLVALLIVGRRDPGLLIPLALAAGVVWNLWAPTEAQRFFAHPASSKRDQREPQTGLAGMLDGLGGQESIARLRETLAHPGSLARSVDPQARVRRLQSDYELVLDLFREHPHVSVTPRDEDLPPESYTVEFRVRGLSLNGEQPEYRDVHQVEINLPSAYPEEPPNVIALTPIFHPNVRDHYHIADRWKAGMTLADLIVVLGDIIQWRAYNFDGSLDAIAEKWAREQEPTGLFPIGNINLGLEIPKRGGARAMPAPSAAAAGAAMPYLAPDET